MEGLEEIADLYQFDLALSSLHGLTAFLYLEQGLYDDAVQAADVHYTEHDDPLFNVLALSTKAKAEVLAGDSRGALQSLATAEKVLERAPGVVPPYYRSAAARSRLLWEVDALDRENGGGDPRRARKAARAALATVRRVACRRAEVQRLEARRRALAGQRSAAQAWWERARDEAQRLGMQPELARIADERASRA
jgi:hypothetical protein